MTEHLATATPAVQARVREHGGDALLDSLNTLLLGVEEDIVWRVDAREDEWEADEIFDWSVVECSAFRDAVAYFELAIDVAVYRTAPGAIQSEGQVVTRVTGFARVKLEPALDADRFELDFDTLRSFIAHDLLREFEFELPTPLEARGVIDAEKVRVSWAPEVADDATQVLILEWNGETRRFRITDAEITAPPVPSTARVASRDPDEDARLDQAHVAKQRAIYAELRELGLLPEPGDGTTRAEMAEYLATNTSDEAPPFPALDEEGPPADGSQ